MTGEPKRGSWDPLLTAAMLAFEVTIRRGERTRKMVGFLDGFVRALHKAGQVPPRWIVYPLAAYRESLRLGHLDGVAPAVALELLDWMLRGLPEESRRRALRVMLEHVAQTMGEAGFPPPDWVQAAWERWRE
ncbi:MAG TPA: hypothetical protein VGR37_11780 [Longimicrobiaceae bacterium]|nr:hypothetical protein [Longimicrobiaceae bacterium]